MLNHLDIFVIDADGIVWTATWEPDFNDVFHGWWTVDAALTFEPDTGLTAISASTDVLTLLAAKPADLWWNSWSPTSGGWGTWTSIEANSGVRPHIAAVSIEPGRIDVVGKVQLFDESSFRFTDQWRVDAWRSNDTGTGSSVVVDWCDMGDVTVDPGYGLPQSYVCSYF